MFKTTLIYKVFPAELKPKSTADKSLEVLFQPLHLGAIAIPNPMIMAPLTRARSGESRIPNDLMVEYYTQRATAGLIISEATKISEQGADYTNYIK